MIQHVVGRHERDTRVSRERHAPVELFPIVGAIADAHAERETIRVEYCLQPPNRPFDLLASLRLRKRDRQQADGVPGNIIHSQKTCTL